MLAKIHSICNMKYVPIVEIIKIRFFGAKNFVSLLLTGELQSEELFKF